MHHFKKRSSTYDLTPLGIPLNSEQPSSNGVFCRDNGGNLKFKSFFNSKGLLTMKYTYIITTQCIVTFSTNENKGCYINSQYFPQYIYIIIISLYGGLIPTGICGLYQ